MCGQKTIEKRLASILGAHEARRIAKVEVTAPWSKVKSLNKADVAHLWANMSKHVQAEEASINRSRTRGRTKFPRSRSQHQGQRSNP